MQYLVDYLNKWIRKNGSGNIRDGFFTGIQHGLQYWYHNPVHPGDKADFVNEVNTFVLEAAAAIS